ncbi:MAG: protein-L-isoaspartate(D-aspartate) O-methyltransferase, partial [Planctomycetota bacterium]
VPREEFVPDDLRARAYDDSPLPIGQGQTISQPYIVATMLEALELMPEDRVLEVGSGSGYAAAVASRIVKQVFGVERLKPLVDQAKLRLERLGYDNVLLTHGDGTLGWPEHAPFDAIIVSAGGPDIPPALLQQLKVAGRLIMPVGTGPGDQALVLIRRVDEESVKREKLGRVRFVPLVPSS